MTVGWLICNGSFNNGYIDLSRAEHWTRMKLKLKT